MACGDNDKGDATLENFFLGEGRLEKGLRKKSVLLEVLRIKWML